MKEMIVYMYSRRMLSSHKKNEILTMCKNVDGSRELYATWNKPERKRQILYNLTYMWSLKNLSS